MHVHKSGCDDFAGDINNIRTIWLSDSFFQSPDLAVNYQQVRDVI